MNNSDIFLKNNLGEVTHIVLTKERYESLTNTKNIDDYNGINLPYANNQTEPLIKFLEYFISNNIEIMPINNKACTLSDFKEEHLKTTLDPVIRSYILGEDSPYRNTMQAVNDVVNQLVKTGFFKLINVNGSNFGFKRRVRALQIDTAKAKHYLKEQQKI